MWLRIGALFLLLGAVAWMFDVAHVNAWLSSFVIFGGLLAIILGPSWRTPEKADTKAEIAIAYRWRAVGGIGLLVVAVWLLSDEMAGTSAVALWVAIALFSYRAPWLTGRRKRQALN